MRTSPSHSRSTHRLLKPGMRLAVGLSGGADSVALLCALVERSRELGLVLHAAHLHHGLRGAEADADLEFCRDLAAKLVCPSMSPASTLPPKRAACRKHPLRLMTKLISLRFHRRHRTPAALPVVSKTISGV